MKEEKIFTGTNASATWQQLKNDFKNETELLDYKALLQTGSRKIALNIDVDPGGGFESGYSSTTFSAPLSAPQDLHLSLHKEGLLDEAGKWLGMQDVEIGFPEFDKKVIIKTNNEEKIKAAFSSPFVQSVFGEMEDYSLKIKHHKIDEREMPFLELVIENNVPDLEELQSIYEAFFQLLNSIDGE